MNRGMVAVAGLGGIAVAVLLFALTMTDLEGGSVSAPAVVPTQGAEGPARTPETTPGAKMPATPVAASPMTRPGSAPTADVVAGEARGVQILPDEISGPNPLSAAGERRRNIPEGVAARNLATPANVLSRQLSGFSNDPEAKELSGEWGRMLTDLRTFGLQPKAEDFAIYRADMDALVKRTQAGGYDNKNAMVAQAISILEKDLENYDAELRAAGN